MSDSHPFALTLDWIAAQKEQPNIPLGPVHCGTISVGILSEAMKLNLRAFSCPGIKGTYYSVVRVCCFEPWQILYLLVFRGPLRSSDLYGRG